MIVIEKEGFRFIPIFLIPGVILLFLFWPAGVLLVLLALGVTLFFRETKTGKVFSDTDIVSPASGKVIDIREVYEPEYLKIRAVRVSIFMSLFDEHVNYSPFESEVEYLRHQPGGFKRAYLDEASAGNEAQYIGLRGAEFSGLVKQIAGVIARRIVCRCRPGDKLAPGEKLGLIRFGSRVELFFPPDTDLNLKVGEKVLGGRTIIGKIQ